MPPIKSSTHASPWTSTALAPSLINALMSPTDLPELRSLTLHALITDQSLERLAQARFPKLQALGLQSQHGVGDLTPQGLMHLTQAHFLMLRSIAHPCAPTLSDARRQALFAALPSLELLCDP